MRDVNPPRGLPTALVATAVALLLSCRQPGDPSPDPAAAPDSGGIATACGAAVTPISAVQGNGYRSPLAGERVTVLGTVTQSDTNRGFFLEDTTAPSNPRSSRALFVEAASAALPAVGQQVAVRGRVAETGSARDTLTSLVDTEHWAPCGEAAELPLTHTSLPLGSSQREALEGMRVALDGETVVTDAYNAHRGEWTVAAGGPLRIPTEDVAPGEMAAEAARTNRDREIAVRLPERERHNLPVGTPVGLRGVMGHDGRGQRLMAERATLNTPIDLPGVPVPTGSAVRIVSMNLLNFFNGDGRGAGFPTERGAKSLQEFEEQQLRTRAALTKIRPVLLAVQELENDGFGRDSAARTLLSLLNQSVAGNGEWAMVDPGMGPIGGDVITVGLFYASQKLEPAGAPRVLQTTPFQGLSRQPLAQRFLDRVSGIDFWVVVNHLKSKGSCPETGPNRAQNDGQGCWNPARVAAVRALVPWLETLSRESGTPRVLILGDMNAWRQEDPIRAYRQAGYLELVEERSGLPQYSYVYFGQRGTLDYAFASPELAHYAQRAFIWHSNADLPRQMPLPNPWLRMSDHDPVIVDLDFSHASTSN